MNARTLAAAALSVALSVACGGTVSTGSGSGQSGGSGGTAAAGGTWPGGGSGGQAAAGGAPGSGGSGGTCSAGVTRCGGVCCTGTCTSGRCLVVLASGQDVPLRIAVNSTSVYWSARRTVKRVGLDGGAPFTLASGQDGPLAIALSSARVLWTSQVYGTGGSVQSLVTDAKNPPVPVASGAWYPYPGGVVVTDSATFSETVLWVAQRIAGGAVVMKAPLYGGSPVTLATVSNVLSEPEDIATDAAGSAYWTDSGTDTVNKVGIHGGAVVPLASKQAFPFGIAVAGTNVYWADMDGGTIMTTLKSPVSGAAPSTLASGQDQPTRIAVDASHLYWANSGAHTIMRMSLGGGKPVTLISGQAAKDIALDSTSVYWTDPDAGTVMKLTPK